MIIKCTATFAGTTDTSRKHGGCQDFAEFTNSIKRLGNIEIVGLLILDSFQFIGEFI
jgi:hypothetical protein